MNIVKKISIIIMLLGIFVAVNACGDVGSVNSVDKCKVKVGKNDKGDRIKFTGFVFAAEADFIAAIGENAVVTIESEDNPDLSVATFTFPIEEDNLKNGKYKSSKVKPVDKSDPVTSFTVDTIKGKMKFSAKNVDLTGLSCPITVTIQIGDSEVVVVGGYTMVDTGQAACYGSDDVIACPLAGEAFYGQDAQTSGSQSSYTNTNDGIISDTITGLMWQQSPDTEGDGDIDADDKLTYDEAVAKASTQTTGGYSDWRLPTIKELYSLIDFNGVDPSGYEGSDTSGLIPFIDTDYFDFAYGDTDAEERIIDAQYASSTMYVDGELLFGVNFADGRIKGYGLQMPFGPGEKTFFVMYVRGNAEYGINVFIDNGDGTITDSATDLMWAKDDSGYSLNWQEALAWVQTKNAENHLGHNDWRLPNVKELESIVDYTRSPGTSASAAIDPLFNATAIINESGQTDYPCYWSGTTHANWTGTPGAFGAYVAFGRAMGYMDGSWSDVHGAGAQRSDPKAGDPDDYPTGNGPQGDAIRIYNYVRCVRTILN